ncbi:MAG: TatD family hydrolase [Candidatus Fimenecus sp.]
MIFDTHAHYDDKAFDEDRDELLTSLKEQRVSGIITCGVNLETSKKSVELSEKYDFVYAAVGFHGLNTDDLIENYIDEIKALVRQNKKVVAIGECGLDYYYSKEKKDLQIKIFTEQVRLAKELDLPIIVHDREAHFDIMNILKAYRPSGVIHCFTGSIEMMREAVKIGMYIGLGGAVTFKNSKKPKEVAKEVPIERLLLETDAPYMTPVPFRGKRNNSAYITYVADEISAIRSMKKETLLSETEKNARRLFNII